MSEAPRLNVVNTAGMSKEKREHVMRENLQKNNKVLNEYAKATGAPHSEEKSK